MASLYGVLNPFAPSELRKIHQASLTILEKAGAFVAHDRTLDCLAAAQNADKSANQRGRPRCLL